MFADVLIIKDTDNYILIESYNCSAELSELSKENICYCFLNFFKTKDIIYLENFLNILYKKPDSIDLNKAGNLNYFLFINNFLKRTKKGKYILNKSPQFVRYTKKYKQIR